MAHCLTGRNAGRYAQSSEPRPHGTPFRGTYWVKAKTLCQGDGFPRPIERGVIGPHAMHDDRELARHGDDRATEPTAFGDGRAPGLQRGPSMDAGEYLPTKW
jgi:hypothetical protein